MTQGIEGSCYLIEGHIEFRPQENLLYSRINEEKVTLFIAASRCLQVLLSKQGEVVSQQKLFDAGWENSGMSVSNNTFYQNILTLRRGFKQVGCDKVVIKTIPRHGLIVPSDIGVEKLPLGAVNVTPDIERLSSEGVELKAVLDIIPAMSAIPEPESPIRKLLRNKQSWFLPLGAGLFLIFALQWVFFHTRSTGQNYFDRYHSIGQVGECSVYLFSGKTTLENYMKFVDKYNISCKEKKVVYFASYPYIPQVSIIRCDHSFDSSGTHNCISEYYMDAWDEN